MRTERETQTINRMLAGAGLGTLDDPGFVNQIRFLVANVVQSHEQFRQLLNKCEPADRRAMYEQLVPALRFRAKPLDVYLAETADLAERKQLPTIAEDGTLKPFRLAEIHALAHIGSGQETFEPGDVVSIDSVNRINPLLAEAVANEHLEMVCGWCTRTETFAGWNKDACVQAARKAGWTHSVVTNQEVCPKCLPK